MDPLAELFNEALGFAQEGHLRLARERLVVLLCMAPNDGEARLLLAQVHVADQEWEEALRLLDEARELGEDVPRDLRRSVEDQLLAARAYANEQRMAVTARTEGSAESMRTELVSLRGENHELVVQVGRLHREVRKWTWSTLGVSVLSIGCVAGLLVWGTIPGPIEVARSLEVAAPAGDVAEPPPLAVAQLPEPTAVTLPEPSPVTLPQQPNVPVVILAEPPDPASQIEALPSGDPIVAPDPAPDRATPVAPAPNTAVDPLRMQIEGVRAAWQMGGTFDYRLGPNGLVTLSGSVPSFLERKELEKQLLALSGVEQVDATRIDVLSLRQGAEHYVAPGDTLSEIAYRYYGDQSRIGPLETANRVTAETLRAGKRIVVPPVR